MKKSIVVIVLIFSILTINYFISKRQSVIKDPPISNEEEPVSQSTLEDKIVFHIKGAVKNPGVYEIAYGSYLQQALDLAGGSVSANLDCLNLAQVIIPYQEIVVPHENQSCEVGTTGKDDLININTAGVSELQTIKGIGQAKAEAIVNYRSKTPFKQIEEITNVDGISNNLFEKIKSEITV